MIAALMIAIVSTACSHVVEVPRNEFAAISRVESGEHRIHTKAGDEYRAAGFEVTSESVSVFKLSSSDSHPDVAMPVVIPLEEVKSIERVENGPPLWMIVAVGAVGIAAFIGAMALISGGDAFTD